MAEASPVFRSFSLQNIFFTDFNGKIREFDKEVYIE